MVLRSTSMTHPKRADHFKKWASLMLEQALVPERIQYKQTSGKKSGKGVKGTSRPRRRRIRRMRKRKED